MKKIILFTAISLSTLISSAQCNADFTWSVSGSTVQITNTSTGVDNYDWWFDDGTSSTATNPNHTFASAGTYEICLYAYYMDSTGGFCDDSICHQVTVFQDSTGNGCDADATIYGSNDQIIGIGNTSGTPLFDWTVYDYTTGALLTTITTPNMTYSPGYYGSFWVCLTAYIDSTGAGCDTICEQVTLMDSLDSNLTVVNHNLLSFKLYPNPTQNVLSIQLDQSPSTAHALIVDLLGREMIQIELINQVTEVNVAEFPSGVYIVQFMNDSNQLISSTKFIRN